VLAAVGRDDGKVTYLPEDRHNTLNKRPDITKAKEALGHDPCTPLEVGVPKTVEWMREVYQMS